MKKKSIIIIISCVIASLMLVIFTPFVVLGIRTDNLKSDYDYLRSEYVNCAGDKSRVYMITHYLKTYDATQKSEVPFNLFPRQKDLCRILGDANSVVTTKPRQAGITTTCGAFIACELALADPSSPQTVLVIGNTIDLAQQMVSKIREFLFQFPAWI